MGTLKTTSYHCHACNYEWLHGDEKKKAVKYCPACGFDLAWAQKTK